LRPGIVHRLDRETSGVLVVAKTEQAFEELKKLFQNRKIEKTYVALVYGHTPELKGVINKPLARQKGKLKRTVAKTESALTKSQEALTLYCVINRYKNFDLLEVTPKTGRTHQIRAQLSFEQNPILGDTIYGGQGHKLPFEWQALQCTELAFDYEQQQFHWQLSSLNDIHL
jgi:23S rRNA pseudouridine1911/1915/1917 synthase